MDSITVHYGKQELLDAIINRLITTQVKSVPFVISEIISGRAAPFVREVLDGYFAGIPSVSLACAIPFTAAGRLRLPINQCWYSKETRFPWLAGYAFNNVDQPICNCWNVQLVAKAIRQPVRSSVPALISAGDVDPWCGPSFNRLIKRAIPNAQLMLHDKGHGAGFSAGGINYSDAFIIALGQRIQVPGSGVLIE